MQEIKQGLKTIQKEMAERQDFPLSKVRSSPSVVMQVVRWH